MTEVYDEHVTEEDSQLPKAIWNTFKNHFPFIFDDDYKLDAQRLRNTTDTELVRIPGIGITSLKKIRKHYPYEEIKATPDRLRAVERRIRNIAAKTNKLMSELADEIAQLRIPT